LLLRRALSRSAADPVRNTESPQRRGLDANAGFVVLRLGKAAPSIIDVQKARDAAYHGLRWSAE